MKDSDLNYQVTWDNLLSQSEYFQEVSCGMVRTEKQQREVAQISLKKVISACALS